MKDLELDRNYKKGSRGRKIKLIQEWLCLHNFHVYIDGDFGPATDYAVRQFQRKKRLLADGVVGKACFAELVKPMIRAIRSASSVKKSFGQMVVCYAKQHLKQHPREVGGQNKGPWVRLYMKGNEGRAWSWCAGFVSFILKQAGRSLKISTPVKTSLSCNTLAANAKRREIFFNGSRIKNKSQIAPGSLFISRKTASNWVHAGIVIQADDEVFHTIEGNTNDKGSHEGYEVCRMVRGYKNKDFILI